MAKQDQSISKLKRLTLSLNPLRNLTNPDIENLIQTSKFGNDIRLQMAYQEMEKVTPIFGICIERRISEILNRGWQVIPLEENDNSLETTNQIDRLTKLLKTSEYKTDGSLTNAIRHLALYAFRGRSCVKPFYTDNTLEFTCLNNVNVLKSIDNKYYWSNDNLLIGDDFTSLVEIPAEEIVAITTDKPIDYPGLLVYLRQTIGELQWARFVEKQGIPQVVITAPDGTTDGQYTQFTQRAQAIYEGGSGTLPYGTTLNVLDSARGQDPFSEFIAHQQDVIAILALGSTAAIFPQNSGLGSDLNTTQTKILNNLVSQDCRLIQNALSNNFKNNGFDKVRFEFNGLKNYSIQEMISLVQSLKDIGLPIDSDKLIKTLDLDIFVDKPSEQVWSVPTK